MPDMPDIPDGWSWQAKLDTGDAPTGRIRKPPQVTVLLLTCDDESFRPLGTAGPIPLPYDFKDSHLDAAIRLGARTIWDRLGQSVRVGNQLGVTIAVN